MKKGYTLIELIISFGILSVIGGIVLGIITTSLRTSSKTEELDVVRQNGDNAITQLERMIRYAQSFNGVSLTGAANSYTKSCNPTAQYKYLKISSFSPLPYNQTILSCPLADSSGANIASTSAATNATVTFLDATAVSLPAASCSFTCDTTSGQPIIGVNFTLTLKKATVIGTQTALPFHSSVTLRNAQ